MNRSFSREVDGVTPNMAVKRDASSHSFVYPSRATLASSPSRAAVAAARPLPFVSFKVP